MILARPLARSRLISAACQRPAIFVVDVIIDFLSTPEHLMPATG